MRTLTAFCTRVRRARKDLAVNILNHPEHHHRHAKKISGSMDHRLLVVAASRVGSQKDKTTKAAVSRG